MNYGPSTSSALGYAGQGPEEARPATDLESIRDALVGSVSFVQEMNAMLAAISVKLRGSMPEPGTKQTALAAVPAGILGELREHHEALSNQHYKALELIQTIKTAI